MIADLPLRGQSGRWDSQSGISEGERLAGTIVGTVNHPIDGNFASGGICGAARRRPYRQICARPDMAEVALPERLSTAAQCARNGSAFQLRPVEGLLRSTQREAMQ